MQRYEIINAAERGHLQTLEDGTFDIVLSQLEFETLLQELPIVEKKDYPILLAYTRKVDKLQRVDFVRVRQANR